MSSSPMLDGGETSRLGTETESQLDRRSHALSEMVRLKYPWAEAEESGPSDVLGKIAGKMAKR